MASKANDGLFSDESMIRRVSNEGVLLLGGGRALLLQIANPLVAAGVEEHSSFRVNGSDRLLRTLRLTLAIVFGSKRQAMAAVRQINSVHARVSGDGYSATDAELLMWVLATLVDTALVAHALFVRPLSEAEAAAYYADMRTIGRLVGIPSDTMPADIQAFRRYMKGATASLHVSPAGRALARDILGSAPGGLPGRWLMKQLTTELLPPRLRQELGLSNGPTGGRLVRLLAKSSRTMIRFAPPALRRPPWFVMPPQERAGGQTSRRAEDARYRSP